jgi:hypothetical protein
MEIRELLRAIKNTLEDALLVKPRGVFISPADNWMPTGTPLPAIGITDGGVPRREELLSCEVAERVRVLLTCWVDMAHTGEELLDNGHLLHLAELVDQRLDTNTLQLDAVLHGWATSEGGSQLFVTEARRLLARKIITYEYEIERPRARERAS